MERGKRAQKKQQKRRLRKTESEKNFYAVDVCLFALFNIIGTASASLIIRICVCVSTYILRALLAFVMVQVANMIS